MDVDFCRAHQVEQPVKPRVHFEPDEIVKAVALNKVAQAAVVAGPCRGHVAGDGHPAAKTVLLQQACKVYCVFNLFARVKARDH